MSEAWAMRLLKSKGLLVSTKARCLLDVTVKLPQGDISVAELTQVLKDHGAQPQLERLKRLPDRRGEWSYVTAELQLWVSEEEYRSLLQDLDELRAKGFEVDVAYIQRLESLTLKQDAARGAEEASP